ncbi:sugar transferase [Vagococcus vulneris]|uniref:UDP-phosphate N-acetylgalactosaminyl-1-phosphate transferase n=1 Tax=Vagococcus vulneris TaxID=1977869 RepID=A0A429ZZT6_9ENTE|nr:sugar transferase [Vagococcus vulneris]RST99568.1 UDP-phosphate N-acetylgalactosaminyl-1-phosphate transferase [Vagococcus vulneris]
MESEAIMEKSGYLIAKRICDFFIGIIGFILSLPIILIFCVIIRLESKGSPLYLQKRVGKNGREFTLAKLRSMRMDAEKDGPKWADKEDNRVTKVGSFIRKTRIDELPQFFNLITGDMSLIGPRPERQVFIDEFLEYIPDFNDRLKVKPGITGYAQVNGGYEITPKEKLKLDKIYIENLCFKMDLKVFFDTIRVVITGNGAR